ncbi:sugar phosphate nucleotidyltransferase [Roseibacillus ishigakijimensis]|uniref:NTP transferase domain-containing protein n=1 Tax=Roseibacillus ishigakijimensis TaxID=454146 RepID=A0A934RP64_9BACT|nr:sugar phosphate nucleotidyltransferase [Roseibacillus ishigakijimensis]MBK1834413.1 NTP transferase domain-containing protein [Roseibacillus ishigakijimensis]
MKKAFLLGAGLGTRLRPLTNTVPKPLVPVFHRPLACHALDHLAEAGIEEVAINTHHLHQEWERTFPDATYRDLQLHFFHERELLETGGGIKNIATFIGDDSVLVYNGDILTNIDLQGLIARHRSGGGSITLASRSTGPGLHLEVQGEQVIDIRNKLGRGAGTHQFTGIYCLEPEVLDLIPPREKISIIPAFLTLAQGEKLGAFDADKGHWLDLGTREAYLETHGIGGEMPPGLDHPRVHQSARVVADAHIENSWIGPDCVVGAGALVRDSILWPGTVVTAGARLERCIVHSSTPVSGTHEDRDL